MKGEVISYGVSGIIIVPFCIDRVLMFDVFFFSLLIVRLQIW